MATIERPVGRVYRTRESTRAASAARAQRLKDAGLCVRCAARPARPGQYECAECADLRRMSAANRKDIRRLLHLCYVCGERLPEDYWFTYCPACKQQAAEHNAAYRARKKAQQEERTGDNER